MTPQFAKSLMKSQKNDANDAEAICEAVIRPHAHAVRASRGSKSRSTKARLAHVPAHFSHLARCGRKQRSEFSSE